MTHNILESVHNDMVYNRTNTKNGIKNYNSITDIQKYIKWNSNCIMLDYE